MGSTRTPHGAENILQVCLLPFYLEMIRLPACLSPRREDLVIRRYPRERRKSFPSTTAKAKSLMSTINKDRTTFLVIWPRFTELKHYMTALIPVWLLSHRDWYWRGLTFVMRDSSLRGLSTYCVRPLWIPILLLWRSRCYFPVAFILLIGRHFNKRYNENVHRAKLC